MNRNEQELYKDIKRLSIAMEKLVKLLTKVIKEKEGTPYPPGYYVISDRIVKVDEQGNVNKVL